MRLLKWPVPLPGGLGHQSLFLVWASCGVQYIAWHFKNVIK